MLTLWKHQRAGSEEMLKHPEYCLFFDPGTGKTATAINALRFIYSQHGKIRETLIVAPLIVLKNWKREFALHSKISQRHICVLDQPGAKRVQEFEKMRRETSGAFVAITNYEGMQIEKFYQALFDWHPEIMILDESHRVKNPKSKRAKAVLNLARRASRRYLLTGTPILNSALDIFMQFRILEGDRPLFDRYSHAPVKGATFGDNFFAFRGQYFVDVNARWKEKHNYFPDWQPRPQAHAELNQKIARKSMRILKKDCLDLPPLVRQTIEIDFSPEQRRLYNDMKKHFIAFLDDSKGQPRATVAQLAITKALRLQQICSGYIKTDDEKEMPLEGTPREKALAELLEDLTPSHKVIVWAVFRYNYMQIMKVCEKLGLKYGLLTGDTPVKDKNAYIEGFQIDPSLRVMIANQSAGGIGINLTAASYSIFFSRNFSLEADLQAMARNYRGGSEVHTKITRIDLVVPNSIDSLVLKALANKETISEAILDWKL